MATIENLMNPEAIKKLKELAESARVCLFCTDLKSQPIATRPMSLQEVDADGNLWFISSIESNKNIDIISNGKVQLFFSNNSASEYLSVFGKAYIYTNRSTVEEKRSSFANVWFEGKDDPTISIIRVAPKDTKYWDTRNGKMVTLLKMATSALTGTKKDEGGVEGKLDI